LPGLRHRQDWTLSQPLIYLPADGSTYPRLLVVHRFVFITRPIQA
jgi:hypothetical protein